jgi:hypothetical protein
LKKEEKMKALNKIKTFSETVLKKYASSILEKRKGTCQKGKKYKNNKEV